MKYKLVNNRCQYQIIDNNVKEYIENATVSELQSINTLVNYSNIYGTVYAGQNRMADKAGIARQTFNKNIQKFQEHGLLMKRYFHRKTCSYYLHPIFFNYSFRKKLSRFIKAFKWEPKHVILSVWLSSQLFNISCLSEKVTPYKKSLSYNSLFTNSSKELHIEEAAIEEKNASKIKNNKDTNHFTSSNYDKNKHFNLNNSKKGVVMIDKVKKELGFGDYEAEQLMHFSDAVLADALKYVLKTKDVNNKFKFMLGCCKAAEKRMGNFNKGDYNVTKQAVSQKLVADLGVIPSISLTHEQNLKRWNDYEDKESTQLFIAQDERSANIIKNRKMKFMHDLSKQEVPETMERRTKEANRIREAYPYTIQGVNDFNEMLGIETKVESLPLNKVELTTLKGIPTAFALAEYLAVLKKNDDWAKISDIINVEYSSDGNNNDMVAEYYIKTIKAYLNSKDNIDRRTNIQPELKDSTQLNVDDIYSYEEVFD